MSSFRTLVERQKSKSRDGAGPAGGAGTAPGKPADKTAKAAGPRAGSKPETIPEEFGIKTRLDEARLALKHIIKPSERTEKMAEIAVLEARYEAVREARRRTQR